MHSFKTNDVESMNLGSVHVSNEPPLTFRSVGHARDIGLSQEADSEIVMVDGMLFSRLSATRSVMGRLWDDHFRDLGYPTKFYRTQDAGFDNGSSS